MKIRTNAENRKDIVKAVIEITGYPSKYLGVPSCRYQVGNCFIEKNGEVVTADEKTGAIVEAGLLARGLVNEPETDSNRMLVQFPLADMTALNLKNLIFLIHSRQYLINKSAGETFLSVSNTLIEELQGNEFENLEGVILALRAYEDENRGFRVDEGKLEFRFPCTDSPVRENAYRNLATAVVRQATEQKRIDPEDRVEENEKYYMRIWLLRIGFGGKEMKDSRNVLMENLKGHSAFRTQEDIERAKIRNRQRKQEQQTVAETSVASESTMTAAIPDKTNG
ncbi:hypothetical protein [Lacrimispora brassicae]